MKEKLSEFYKKKGFISLYVNVNKEPRRVATLRKHDKTLYSISYAKYLYTSINEIDIPDGYEIDHINNDKMDDCIENLQVLSKKENFNKSKKIKETIELVCPVCNKVFTFEKRNLSTHPNPCCSRRCGGIKSHW